MCVMPLDLGQCGGLVGIYVTLNSRAAIALAKSCNISFQSFCVKVTNFSFLHHCENTYNNHSTCMEWEDWAYTNRS